VAYLDEYNAAKQNLEELRGLYAVGGGYGAGQYATIESEAKKAGAESMAAGVASGMSSGTGVAGLRARLGKDVTTAKLGVEDARTQKYGEALTGLAGLRSTIAGTMAGAETAAAGETAATGRLTMQLKSEEARQTQALAQQLNISNAELSQQRDLTLGEYQLRKSISDSELAQQLNISTNQLNQSKELTLAQLAQEKELGYAALSQAASATQLTYNAKTYTPPISYMDESDFYGSSPAKTPATTGLQTVASKNYVAPTTNQNAALAAGKGPLSVQAADELRASVFAPVTLPWENW
jgi:hypothetical protein